MPALAKKSFGRWLRLLLFFVLIGPLLPGAGLAPTAVQAETSADPDAEIVYIDNTGVVRILDILQTGSNPKVDWVSPSNGWERFVLGDVNNDGDQEIIAIKEVNNQGILTVWDPVVASGAFDAKTPNGIPWAKLYETAIPGNPRLVGAGKLDANLPGDHIVYVFEVSAVTQRMVVLKPTSATPNGREWTVHFTRDFNEQWEAISVGNVDNAGADEIALVDRTQGRLAVYRADAQSSAMLSRTGEARPYRVGLLAQFDGNRGKEVIAIRNGELLPSFFVLKYGDGSFTEEVIEAFTPSPRFAFAADINNDGKEEVVMLRQVEAENAIRMIVRGDDPGEIPVELERPLDKDNGYESGAGGDVDGDGKDEIVIMRDNKIRVYHQPDRNADFNDYGVLTNKDSIQVGDLDRNGFKVGDLFGSSVSTIEETLQIGTTGLDKVIELKNITANTPISYKAEVEGAPGWFTVSPSFGNTPAILTYRANAIGLAAGDYTTRIKFTSDTQAVVNQPFYVQVKLKVTPALLEPRPDSMVFAYLTSQQPLTLTRSIGIFGTDGVKFTAAVASIPSVQRAMATLAGDIRTGYIADDGRVVLQDELGNEATLDLSADAAASVPWLAITPTEGTIPATLTITATTSSQVNDFEQAFIVVIGDARTGRPPQNVRLITVTVLRSAFQIFMPSVFK